MNVCTPWSGTINNNGYGVKYVNGRRMGAHRWAWEQAHGTTIPSGMVVRHSCDNKSCVNPDHLLLGTHADNSHDAVERGRYRNQWTKATHCKRGHEFTDENTYWYRGARHCKTCRLWRQRRWHEGRRSSTYVASVAGTASSTPRVFGTA